MDTGRETRPRRSAKELKRRPLRLKLVAATLAVTAATALLLDVKSYLNARTQAHGEAIRALTYEADIYTDRIGAAFGQMVQDAALLADLPPMVGLLSAVASPTHIDPLSGRTRQSWAQELETTFRYVLRRRPTYIQARVVSLANGWRDVVRVTHATAGSPAESARGAATDAAVPYLAAAAHSTTGYFAPVSQAEDTDPLPGRPVIRFVLPLANAKGSKFGALVLDADFEALMRAAAPAPQPGHRVTLITEDLDHLVLDDTGARTGMLFHHDPAWVPPEMGGLLNDFAGPSATYETKTDILHLSTAGLAGDALAAPVYVLTQAPKALLMAGAAGALRQNLALSLAMVLLAGSTIYLIAGRLTGPLEDLARSISERKTLTDPVVFKPTGRDEVSDLAVQFSQMANQLSEEARWQRSVLDCAADGMMIVSDDGVISQANPAAEAIFGYAGGALIGRPIEVLIPERSRAQHKVQIAQSVHTDRHRDKLMNLREVGGVRSDGSDVAIEVTVAAVDFADRRHFIANARDISARKEAEAHIKKLIASLERANAEMDRFTYVASHDLKAPLRVIQNATDWLTEDLEPVLDAESRENLGLLQSRAVRMERLLDDLLKHSRIGRGSLPSVEIPGSEFAQELASLFQLPAGGQLSFSDAFLAANLRRMPLQAVLSNLIENALTHHDRTDPKVEVQLTDAGDGYWIAVVDDGPGIAETYHDKIFEIFQTLKPRDVVDSSGMGLAFVKKHLDVIGGRIEVDSDGCRGTTFRVWWPKQINTEIAA